MPHAGWFRTRPLGNADNTASRILQSPHCITKFNSILTLVGFVILYIQVVNPRLSVNINQNPSNIFNSDFIFTNEWYIFTLYNAKIGVALEEFNMKYGVYIENSHTKRPTNYLNIGDIETRDNSTARIPFDNNESKNASVCLLVSYKFKFLRVFERNQKFGFYFDKTEGTDHWIRRPCKNRSGILIE